MTHCMRAGIFCFLLFVSFFAAAQKRPLDPSVYDGWQSIGERILSPDGQYLVYTVVPQEGDGRLMVRSVAGNYAKEIPRGADAVITADSRFVVFHIKPFFKDTREARIRKKTPDQMPKDSVGWLALGTDELVVVPRVKAVAVPEMNGGWLAYLLEKAEPAKTGDSAIGGGRRMGDRATKDTIGEGTDLVLVNLATGQTSRFPRTTEYLFSPRGNTLVVEESRKSGDSLSRALVLWIHTANGTTDTVMRGFHDARNYAIDEQGEQLAFVAERDSMQKALTKFYRLWYYTAGMDSAVIRADKDGIAAALAASGRKTSPLPTERLGFTVSPDFVNRFSKDGDRLFWGIAPIRPPKDTTLADFETARLDVWNYNDDYLQPQQLVQLNNELKRSYLAVLNRNDSRIIPLADADCETVVTTPDGDGRYALGMSTRGFRIQQQWSEVDRHRVFLVDMADGSRKQIGEPIRGAALLSPGGKYFMWYDWKGRNWYTYTIATGRVTNITKGIPVPLYDEEDDHPDDPPPHGYMAWLKNDLKVYVYDKYDIWQCDPQGNVAPLNLTRGVGRRRHWNIRYIPFSYPERTGREEHLPREEPVVHLGETLLLTLFDERDMSAGHVLYKMGTGFHPDTIRRQTFSYSYNGFFKARNRSVYGYLRGSYDKPYDVCVEDSTGGGSGKQFSHINPQQPDYNWLTVELHHWKTFDGRMSKGLLYKPEDFDSTRKYPIIFYFYERDSRTRYNYITPQPVRASINIAYFVSNGYLVFDPDIHYKVGQPGEDAYNSVVSAAAYMSHFKWVDTAKMGLQGHSWGGYQVAYLVTRTHRFAAAEAGAPVANMTSAYGGIRWETGISRQFQYEVSQSRIGATLWQHPERYIKNSPLFNADKVKTPLLMMANDADGAVPWYQGIEYFTALRRLGKKVWMMEYNGEAHGLTERRNRKDWSIRLSQFFGYYLKGEKPPRWMTEGVPAVMKGLDWGLEAD